jgi:hypothetical protein
MRLIRTTNRLKDRDQSDPGHVRWMNTKENIACSGNTEKETPSREIWKEATLFYFIKVLCNSMWKDKRKLPRLSSFHGATASNGPGPPPYQGFTITLRHATLGMTPLDEWSARRSYLYLTTRNNHKDRHPCPTRDSNPQSQQASDRTPTP